MAWARIDDKFHSHPTLMVAGLDATGLFARAISYCADYLTDGFVPRPWADAQGGRKPVQKLIDGGLFLEVEDGLVIKDYLDWNPTREDVRALRGKDARKHALHRDRELVDAVRARDGSVCRYCGTEVEWTDRRSSKGGTYDHVDPEGGNEPENVVVACRGCNAVKGKRTPDQAGIKLRPNPDLIPIRSGSRSGAGPVSVANGTPTPTPTVRTSTAHARSGG